MTTCREFFTFSWPLRGRGRGGRPKRSAWPLFSRFFFTPSPTGFLLTSRAFYWLLRLSTDFLLTFYWLLLAFYWLLHFSTDFLSTSTGFLLTSTHFYWFSTDFFWLSTDFYGFLLTFYWLLLSSLVVPYSEELISRPLVSCLLINMMKCLKGHKFCQIK